MLPQRLKELTLQEDEALIEEYEAIYGTLSDRQKEEADIYAQCIYEGTSPKLAEMFAEQSPPMSNTDREFLEGHCNGNQFDGNEFSGDRIRAMAEANGQSTKGKVYIGGLAQYPGDPEAWVDGRGDVKRVCEKRGWGCESDGSVALKPRDVGRLPAMKSKKEPLARRLQKAGLPLSDAA